MHRTHSQSPAGPDGGHSDPGHSEPGHSDPGHSSADRRGLGSELRQSALLLGLCTVTTVGAAGLAHAAVALLA